MFICLSDVIITNSFTILVKTSAIENLVYACNDCNSSKLDELLPLVYNLLWKLAHTQAKIPFGEKWADKVWSLNNISDFTPQ